MRKVKIILLFGGKSEEREVSAMSAKALIPFFDMDKYEVIPVEVDKRNDWRAKGELVVLKKEGKGFFLEHERGSKTADVEIVFPALHGRYGEDGTLQGMLDLIGIPYVGCGVLASALCMDKEMSKKVLREAGFKVAKYVVAFNSDNNTDVADEVETELEYPVFVKPAMSGSSVGIGRASNRDELMNCMKEALLFDYKILIEEFISGRELEVGVIGDNRIIKVSEVGEVELMSDIYSYDTKYKKDDGVNLQIPAQIGEEITGQIKGGAEAVYRTLRCEGMARVDLFLTEEGDIYVNEVNTIPGFTEKSMFPKLWGEDFSAVIDEIIMLGLIRKNNMSRLKINAKNV